MLPRPFHSPALCCLLFVLATLSAPLSAQRFPGDLQANDPLLLSTADLGTEFFTPQHTDIDELLRVARLLYSRSFQVVERGGYDSQPVQNLQQLGDSLLVYDRREELPTLLSALALLDRPRVEDEPAELAVTVVTWSPGFVSLNSARAALAPLFRNVPLSDDYGYTEVANVSILTQQNALVLRDSQTQVEQMLTLLNSLDKPDPQLTLSAMVIQGHRSAEDATGPMAPEEISSQLSRLVPYEHFSVGARGLVRSSARSPSIEVNMDREHKLEMLPAAYDSKSGTLTARIRFQGLGGFEVETQTSLLPGENVVLGAVGQVPTFVVLRIEAIGG